MVSTSGRHCSNNYSNGDGGSPTTICLRILVTKKSGQNFHNEMKSQALLRMREVVPLVIWLGYGLIKKEHLPDVIAYTFYTHNHDDTV